MLTRFLRFASFLPLMTLLSFGAVVCAARVLLGHWPVPTLDDPDFLPKSALYSNLNDLFTASFGLTLLTAPL